MLDRGTADNLLRTRTSASCLCPGGQARWNKSFKDYGELYRIEGTYTGSSVPTTIDDPLSGNQGYPTMLPDNFTLSNYPVVNAGEVSTPTTQGMGQSYFMKLPALGVLGTTNKNGTQRLDLNYPGYNFNISDQRRALELHQGFRRHGE